MERHCIKTEAWSLRQQIDTEYEDDHANFVAWFEWEYEWVQTAAPITQAITHETVAAAAPSEGAR